MSDYTPEMKAEIIKLANETFVLKNQAYAKLRELEIGLGFDLATIQDIILHPPINKDCAHSEFIGFLNLCWANRLDENQALPGAFTTTCGQTHILLPQRDKIINLANEIIELKNEGVDKAIELDKALGFELSAIDLVLLHCPTLDCTDDAFVEFIIRCRACRTLEEGTEKP